MNPPAQGSWCSSPDKTESDGRRSWMVERRCWRLATFPSCCPCSAFRAAGMWFLDVSRSEPARQSACVQEVPKWQRATCTPALWLLCGYSMISYLFDIRLSHTLTPTPATLSHVLCENCGIDGCVSPRPHTPESRNWGAFGVKSATALIMSGEPPKHSLNVVTPFFAFSDWCVKTLAAGDASKNCGLIV